jgi:hypothetical protein
MGAFSLDETLASGIGTGLSVQFVTSVDEERMRKMRRSGAPTRELAF